MRFAPTDRRFGPLTMEQVAPLSPRGMELQQQVRPQHSSHPYPNHNFKGSTRCHVTERLMPTSCC